MFGSRYIRTVLPHARTACCLITALASAAVLPAQVLTSPLFAATDLRARSSQATIRQERPDKLSPRQIRL